MSMARLGFPLALPLIALLVACGGPTASPERPSSDPSGAQTSKGRRVSETPSPSPSRTTTAIPSQPTPPPVWGVQSGPRFVASVGDRSVHSAPRLPGARDAAGGLLEMSGGWAAKLRITKVGARERVRCEIGRMEWADGLGHTRSRVALVSMNMGCRGRACSFKWSA